MHIAILSDTHDHTDRLRQALDIIKQKNITRAFHLGDLCSPFIVKQLADSSLQWHCVWGNNDGDRLMCSHLAGENVTLSDNDFLELEVEGKRIFLTHYPEVARLAALSGRFDAVFYGHNHTASQEIIAHQSCEGKAATLLVNPGESSGVRFGKPCFAIYDTESNSIEQIELP